MNPMKRKSCSLALLSALLLLLLSGCGGNVVSQNPSETPGTEAALEIETSSEVENSASGQNLESRLLSGSLSDVLLTTEIPETLYRISAANVGDAPSAEEQEEIITALAEVLDYEPLLEEGSELSGGSGTISYPTADGGTVSYGDQNLSYVSAINFAASEDAVKVDTITVAAGDADLTVSYPLSGESYSVGKALDYVESLWNDTLYQYYQFEDMQPFKVLVYDYGGGDYSYALYCNVMYEGLPVEQYSTSLQFTTDDTNGGFRPSFLLIEMDAPEHISVCTAWYSFQVLSTEPITEDILTAEEAVERADEVLAAYTNFQIQEMELCYAARWILDGDAASAYTYEPYWCLVLEWGDAEDELPFQSEFPNVALFIDAQTGTAYLVDSSSYTDLVIYE